MPSLYDHPLYYDILFGWERSAEAGFYDALLRAHDVPAAGSVLELACGTGQIAIRLAAHGWRVTGLDLSRAMLTFLEARAAEAGVQVTTLCDDMVTFSLPEPVHAVYSPMSSFRLLLEEDAARTHLETVARALEPGGIYVLDLTLGTSGEAEDELDEWIETRDGIEVDASTESVRVRDPAVDGIQVLDWHERMRAYTPGELDALIDSCAGLRIEACYPESGQDGDISLFDTGTRCELADGRIMVALQAV